MYEIPFRQIVAQARLQSGFNFPADHHIRTQLMQGKAQNMICVSAQIILKGCEHVVADDDDAHYAMEKVIAQGCLAVWTEIERARLLNLRRG